MKFLSRKKREDGLDAPSSLPDSLSEKDVSSGSSGKDDNKGAGGGSSDSKRIPDDIHRDDFEKLPESQDDLSLGEDVSVGKGSSERLSSGEKEGGALQEDGRHEEEVHAPSPSFFEELEKKVLEKKGVSHEHVSHGLVGLMREFHESRSSGDHFFLHEGDLDDSLYKKMLELKELESEWVVRMREFNAAKELLLEKEREIESKAHALRKLLKHAEKFRLFNKRVSSGNAFKLSSGVVLRSVRDLLHELPSMSDSVFEHHVSGKRNDFADWVLHVFGDRKLAGAVRGASSRDELLRVLKGF